MPTCSSLPILPILPVEGGVLTFDREAGRYALARGPSFAGCQTRAPCRRRVTGPRFEA
jgi:hypothetical protein